MSAYAGGRFCVVEPGDERVAAIVGDIIKTSVLRTEIIQRVCRIEIIPLFPVIPGMSFKSKLDLLLQEDVRVGDGCFRRYSRTDPHGIEILQCLSIGGGSI